MRLAIDLGCLTQGRQTQLIDVGANIGTVCIPAVREGYFRGALAFEPDVRNYRLLCRNIETNGLSGSIQAFNVALSSARGAAELELAADNFGDHRIRTGSPSTGPQRFDEGARRTVAIRIETLDDVLHDLGLEPCDIGLLWMDVQGHEPFVLKGADNLVAAGLPVITEFWPYGLSRAGVMAGEFCRQVADRFSWFYDLADEPPRRQPASAMAQMFEKYRGIDFSDLLLVPTATNDP